MLIIHAFHIAFIANHAPLHGLSEGGKLWLSLLTGLRCAVVGCHLDPTADLAELGASQALLCSAPLHLLRALLGPFKPSSFL